MQIKISKADILWSYAGYVLKFGSGVIILPLILKSLSAYDLGIWYTFVAIGTFVSLLDLGFSQVIPIHMLHIWNGATKLSKNGVESEMLVGNNIDLVLFHKFLYVVKKLYIAISIISLILLLAIGSAFLNKILGNENLFYYLVSWLVYSFSIAVNFYYSYWTVLLVGIGKIKEGQKAVMVGQTISLVIIFCGIISGFGIIVLAASALVSGVFTRCIAKYYFFKTKEIPEDISSSYKYSKSEYKVIFLKLFYNAKKLGLVSLGVYLINQINTVLCSVFLGIEVTAQYGLTLQLFSFLAVMSGVCLRTYLPFFAEANLKNDITGIKNKLGLSAVIGWLIYIFGGVVICFWGEDILFLLGSHTTLLPRYVILIMFLYLFLEFNHGNIFATFITSMNKVPFFYAALLTGMGISILSAILLKYSDLGVYSLVVSSLTIQACYNNWKWPLYVLKHLNMSFLSFTLYGFNQLFMKIKHK